MSEEHIILLGDSVLDNEAYLPPGFPSVHKQVSIAAAMRGNWRVTKRARDGHTIASVMDRQLQPALPNDTTAILLSVGGNNGLAAATRLKSTPILGWWSFLQDFLRNLARQYEELIQTIRTTYADAALILCTVYEPQIPLWIHNTIASVGARFLNREIRRLAERWKLPLIDLWHIFDRKEDYANAIEPGVPGGHKLARNLMFLLESGREARFSHTVWADASYSAVFDIAQWTRFEQNRFFGPASS